MRLVDCILSGNLEGAKELIENRLEEIANQKLDELKKEIAKEEYENMGIELDEANVQKMGRTKLIRIRVRKGKVQRRTKLSAVPGYTIRGGRLVRMSTQERRKRKLGARKAKIKRRGKLSQILRKRRMSLRKRKAMGLK
jgi:hypothetical protein